MDIYATFLASEILSGIGGILRPRQEAFNMSSAAFREGRKAEPRVTASIGTKLRQAPWALQDAAHERAAGQEKSRQRRNSVRAPFLSSGKHGFLYLRHDIAGEVVGA